jgi:thiol-disulfide isomerase/thioredoxin
MPIQKVRKTTKRARSNKKPKIHIIDNKMDVVDNMHMESVSQKKPVIIGLAHWNNCGHCQAMKPDWETMKSRIHSDNSLKNMVTFMEIEKDDNNANEKLAEINSDLVECNPIVINGYPTMFCKRENYVQQYGGGRSADELTNWVRNAALKGQMGGKKTKRRRSGHGRGSGHGVGHVRGRKQTNKKSLLSRLKFW